MADIPESISCLPNLDYVGDGNPRQMLDLYLPPGPPSRGGWPFIVWIHGGGWRNGDRGRLAGEERVVRHGLALARISYRLSDEAIFPAQLDDCRAALNFLKANAQALRLDPEKAFACGHSAGGHLASLVGVGAGESDGPRVRATVNMAGPTDLAFRLDRLDAEKFLQGPGVNVQRLLGGTWPALREKATEASPVTWIGRHTPSPHLLIFGEKDLTVLPEQAERFQVQMEAGGYPCETVMLPGAGHVDASFFDAANLDRVIAFCRRHLTHKA